VGILVVVWLIFAPAEFSYAEDEVTLQVSSSSTTTEQILPGSTVVIQTPEDIIEAAQTAISQAETATAVTKIDAISITSPTWTITDTITQAEISITHAQTVVDSATVAIAEVESATALVAEAEENVEILGIAVELQTLTVSINQDVLTEKQSELNDLESAGNPTITYTTPGYVAPTEDSSIATSVTLQPMWDASTQIQVPFDIKLGDTLFNGQGTNSQIYVSSKAIISFGGPDFTYWGWPNATQDGIYVFQSDYMSAGEGAYILVTTTDTTLKVDWVLHRFGDSNGPLTYITWDMTVNPETGLWTGTGTMSGNTDVYGGPRTGIRQDNILTELTPTSTGYDQDAVIEKQEEVVVAETELFISQQTLTTLQDNLELSQDELIEAQLDLQQAENNLESALLAVSIAISEMNEKVNETKMLVTSTLAEEAAIAALNARVAAELAYKAEQEKIMAEAEAKAAAEVAAKAESDRIAAEDAAAKAKAEEDKAEADKKAEELKAAQEAEIKAKAEANKKAEEAVKAKAEAEKAKVEAEKAKSEQERLEKLAEEANSGKELSAEEKTLIVQALVSSLKSGESISAAQIKSSGISFKDLPPTTPVQLRTDENGNALVITAAVAANIELVQDPGALLTAAFTDPGTALAAFGSIGADMTEEEREESTKMVIATVVAAGAAINAAAIAAAGGSTGGSSGGGGNSGGGSGANSPGSRGGRKW
jgi:hypothetical protein